MEFTMEAIIEGMKMSDEIDKIVESWSNYSEPKIPEEKKGYINISHINVNMLENKHGKI